MQLIRIAKGIDGYVRVPTAKKTPSIEVLGQRDRLSSNGFVL